MERRGVAPLGVSTVDILRRAKFLHPGEAALLSSVQQGGIPTQQVLDVRVPVLHHVQRDVAVTVLLGGVRAMLKNTS